VPWAGKSTPWDFTHELLPPDLERIAPSLEVGFRHFPALERAGIKRIVNGPFTFAPEETSRAIVSGAPRFATPPRRIEAPIDPLPPRPTQWRPSMACSHKAIRWRRSPT